MQIGYRPIDRDKMKGIGEKRRPATAGKPFAKTEAVKKPSEIQPCKKSSVP
jgi:hypothetical protein